MPEKHLVTYVQNILLNNDDKSNINYDHQKNINFLSGAIISLNNQTRFDEIGNKRAILELLRWLNK